MQFEEKIFSIHIFPLQGNCSSGRLNLYVISCIQSTMQLNKINENYNPVIQSFLISGFLYTPLKFKFSFTVDTTVQTKYPPHIPQTQATIVQLPGWSQLVDMILLFLPPATGSPELPFTSFLKHRCCMSGTVLNWDYKLDKFSDILQVYN